jgi:hypothetical protein
MRSCPCWTLTPLAAAALAFGAPAAASADEGG